MVKRRMSSQLIKEASSAKLIAFKSIFTHVLYLHVRGETCAFTIKRYNGSSYKKSKTMAS